MSHNVFHNMFYIMYCIVCILCCIHVCIYANMYIYTLRFRDGLFGLGRENMKAVSQEAMWAKSIRESMKVPSGDIRGT